MTQKSLTFVLTEKIEGAMVVCRPLGTLREGASRDPSLGERLQAHEQKGQEGNSGDRRTTPPTAHHSSGFIATNITSASKLGPRPLLTSLIILESGSGYRAEGGVVASHAIT
jgi:hypothetical protein